MKLLLSLLLLVLACQGQTNKPAWSSNDLWLTNLLVFTNSWGTNFLTLSNRTYVSIRGTALIKFTDSEWNLITNYYKDHLVTNDLVFWGKECVQEYPEWAQWRTVDADGLVNLWAEQPRRYAKFKLWVRNRNATKWQTVGFETPPVHWRRTLERVNQ